MGFLVSVTNITVTKIFQSRMNKAQHVYKQPQVPATPSTIGAEAQIQFRELLFWKISLKCNIDTSGWKTARGEDRGMTAALSRSENPNPACVITNASAPRLFGPGVGAQAVTADGCVHTPQINPLFQKSTGTDFIDPT